MANSFIEPLELKQSYIPHLKVLVGGIDAFSPLWSGCIFVLCYTHMKLALLLHKTATAKYILHSTVFLAILSHSQWSFFYDF